MGTPPPKPRPASPCCGVCRLHPDTGWCEGCYRTIDEIAHWSRLDEAAREVVWQALPARRERTPPPSR